MSVNRIDHLCIAVRDLEQAKEQWAPILGKRQPDESYVDEREQIRVARYYVGEVGFELMESTGPEGEVARFIEKHGEGVMLVSLNVDDTAAEVESLQGKGYPFIPASGGEITRPFRDGKFAFIHPASLNGVLLELIDDGGK